MNKVSLHTLKNSFNFIRETVLLLNPKRLPYYLFVTLYYVLLLTYEEELKIIFLVLKLCHQITFIWRQMWSGEKKMTESPS